VRRDGSPTAWPSSTEDAFRPADLAADLWQGLEAALDLGASIDPRALELVLAVDGVTNATPTVDGVTVHVRDRDVIAVVVATLVGREVPVYSAVPRTPTLEDVYFAIEARFQ
jgi:hypothetical protein